jgi:hypothetical protein
MERKKEASEEKQEGTGTPLSPPDKKPWEEPKVAFIEPKLTKHGDLEKITRGRKNGFFGPFSP